MSKRWEVPMKEGLRKKRKSVTDCLRLKSYEGDLKHW